MGVFASGGGMMTSNARRWEIFWCEGGEEGECFHLVEQWAEPSLGRTTSRLRCGHSYFGTIIVKKGSAPFIVWLTSHLVRHVIAECFFSNYGPSNSNFVQIDDPIATYITAMEEELGGGTSWLFLAIYFHFLISVNNLLEMCHL